MTEPISPQSLAQRYRGKPVRRMHVMVKPTGALCNLDCTYCYYLSKQELLGTPEQWRISDEVLETFLVENPINRYSIGDRTAGLKQDADGSSAAVGLALTLTLPEISGYCLNKSAAVPVDGLKCNNERVKGRRITKEAPRWKF